MATSSALLHPVRLRITQTLLGAGELTTQQLHELIPDIPIATLYRHVSYLATHKLIEVSDEQHIRGTSEKTYRVTPELANPSAAELNSLSTDELLAAFTVFTSGMIRDFDEYLRHETPNLENDRVSFAQASFWASDSELDEFGQALMHALKPLLSNAPAPERRRRTLTTTLIPRVTADDTTHRTEH